MPLTATVIRNAKPQNKTKRLYDERGLYLEISPTGGKWWRFKYRFERKEKRLALGTFPDVSLKQARERRDLARQLLADHVDPAAQRRAMKATQAARATNSFECIGREWFDKFSPDWSRGHFERVKRQLEKDLFPWIGQMNVADIDAPTLLGCLRRIEARGAGASAHRVRSIAGQVFRYAIQTGRAERDPSHDLRGALAPVRGTHFAAITEPEIVGQLLRAIDSFQGTFAVECALKFAPLVFVRPGELRTARWEDIDLEHAEWRYRVSKTQTDHIVPLSRQATEILRDLHPLTGPGTYVFPSVRTPQRPMSENTINASLRRLGIGKDEMTAHGFRAMARTILDEVLNFSPDLIEHQLSHAVKDPNGRAYNRTAHLGKRKRMMQVWADYLDDLKFNV